MTSQLSELNSIYKIVVIGESNCGKTNLITRYCKNEFDEVSRPTIGVEFFQKDLKVMNCQKSFDPIKVQIWDTAGQERFRGMANSYYRKASGVVLVFDLANNNSFQSLEKWIAEMFLYCENSFEVILIGNKKDLLANREVKNEEAQEFARKHNFTYFETSAKNNTDQSIEQAFLDLAHRIHLRQIDNGTSGRSDTVDKKTIERKNQQNLNLNNPNQGRKKLCCG